MLESERSVDHPAVNGREEDAMAPATLERPDRPDRAWIDRHVREWIDAGLISQGQADGIRRFEHFDEEVAPQRLTTVAEVACYLGSVIAFAGGGAIIGPDWGDLGLFGQLAIAFAIAGVAFVVGTWLVRLGEPGTARLGSFLWMIGTGGVALAAGSIVNAIEPRDESWFGVAIGGSVLALGLALWRNLDRPLQLLSAAIGLLITLFGLVALTDASVWLAAIVVWLTAAVFGVLAAIDRVRPRLFGLAVAAVGLMVGSFMFEDLSLRFAAVVAVVTATTIVTYALVDRSLPLLAIGMVAFLAGTIQLMDTVLEGTLARLVAVLVGLAVVALVAVRAQRMGGSGSRPARS